MKGQKNLWGEKKGVQKCKKKKRIRRSPKILDDGPRGEFETGEKKGGANRIQ